LTVLSGSKSERTGRGSWVTCNSMIFDHSLAPSLKIPSARVSCRLLRMPLQIRPPRCYPPLHCRLPVDVIEVAAHFASPAVLTCLVRLNRAAYEKMAPLLYRSIKVVHLESDGFQERARDNKELPIQNLPAVARRHGPHIQELVYYADTPFDAGDIQRELVQAAVDIFCAAVPLLGSLKAFRWHSQTFPDNPRLWPLLQEQRLLHFDVWLYGHLGRLENDQAFSDMRVRSKSSDAFVELKSRSAVRLHGPTVFDSTRL
jgi:hypothetical protein